jgi:hypothetical protein
VLGAQNEIRTATVYFDSDNAICPDTRRSTTGYILMQATSAIAWASRQQPVVAKSTTAAEDIAASMATDELICMATDELICMATDELFCVGKLLKDFGIETTPMLLRVDNAATNASLNNNQIENLKSKYLETPFCFVRERVTNGKIGIEWIPTDQHVY